MGNFLDVCSPMEQSEIGNYHNEKYNEWEKSCLEKLLEKYKEYPDLIKKIRELDTESKDLSSEEKTIETYSKETTLGIGASAAAGGIALGAGGVTLIPMLIRGIMKLFV